jgi:hypothetical protein
MSQLFIADPLQQLLQYWEDCNLCGEYSFQTKERMRRIGKTETPSFKELAPLVGSELDKHGVFSRSIEDYLFLRKVLMGEKYTHKTGFRPRIPKEMREAFSHNSNNFLDHVFLKAPTLISEFLIKWNEARKACIVEQSIGIPLVNLNKGNWLSILPYHSFFLKLNEPINYLDDDKTVKWSLANFLVHEDGEDVRVFAWPNEIETFSFTHDDRLSILNGITALKDPKKESDKSNPRKIEKVLYKHFLVSATVKKGTSLLKQVIGTNGEVIYHDLYDEEFWLSHIKENSMGDKSSQYEQVKMIIGVVNGFSGLVASLPPKPSYQVIEATHATPIEHSPRQWYELPQQVIEYFKNEQQGDKMVIIRSCGGEKSPHIRRGHYRTLSGNQKVWVSETTVRKDKLETEQLQGGAMKIK